MDNGSASHMTHKHAKELKCITIIYILSTGDLGVVQVYPMLGESRVIGLELRAACSILGPMSSGGLYF